MLILTTSVFESEEEHLTEQMSNLAHKSDKYA